MHLGISATCISPHHKYSVNVLLRIGLDQAYTSSVVFVHLAERNTIIVERSEVCAHIVISTKFVLMIYSLTNETEDSIIYLKLIESSLDRILYLSSVPFRKLIPCTTATRNMLLVFPCFTIGDFFFAFDPMERPCCIE